MSHLCLFFSNSWFPIHFKANFQISLHFPSWFAPVSASTLISLLAPAFSVSYSSSCRHVFFQYIFLGFHLSVFWNFSLFPLSLDFDWSQICFQLFFKTSVFYFSTANLGQPAFFQHTVQMLQKMGLRSNIEIQFHAWSTETPALFWSAWEIFTPSKLLTFIPICFQIFLGGK